jgi:tetratricopeptide (TPR) repeat protein
MGAVFLAEDAESGARVALKRMLAPEVERARFLREAAVMSKLTHGGFVRYVAHGEDDQGAWLAMEWLEGSDLAVLLERAIPSFGDGLEIAAQLFEAVVAAHEARVIHRDIKPANVFVLTGTVPRVKVLDFGIARPLDATMVLTATGAIIGTPLYMAPEVLRGQGAAAASDVYAAATVAFELMAGRPPFVADTSFAVIGRILLDQAPSLAQWSVEAPAPIVDILARALQKEPSARPTAAALAHEFRAAANGWAGGDTMAVGGAGAGGIATLFRERRSAAVVVVRKAVDAEATRSFVSARANACDVLPDGTLLALIAEPGASDASLLRAVRVAMDMHARDHGAVIVVSSAETDGTTTSVGGKALARAGNVHAEEPGVHLDLDSSRLLGDRFALAVRGEYATVCGDQQVDEQRLLLGRATPTVGRDAEIAQLSAVVRAVADEGAPRIALVLGPAGNGKTRVRQAVMSELARGARSIPSVLVRFEPGSEGTPWGGLARGIRSTAGIASDDAVESQRTQLDVFATQLGLDATRASFLAEVLGVAGAADQALLDLARASAHGIQEGVHEAVFAVMRGIAGDGASILAFEDAHWADAASLGMVDAIGSLANLPVAVLVFARPELLDRHPDLLRRRSPLRVDLGALPPRAAKRLALAVLPAGADEADVARVVELGAGNPLVLEELLRALIAGGSLTPSLSARAVFESRIASLSAAHRLVARTAAVIGEVFWEPLLATLLRGTGTDTAATLDELIRDELVFARPSSRFREAREIVFRHALLRDAALAMVPDDARRQLSAVIAQWLLDHGEPDLAAVAVHAEQGGLTRLAGELWERTGRAALIAGTPAEAGLMLERALRLLPRDHEARPNLHVALEDTWREIADHTRRARQHAALRRIARLRGGERLRAIAEVHEARWFADRQDLPRADPIAERALARALAAGALDVAASAMIVWFQARDYDQPDERVAELDALIGATETIPPEVRVELLYIRGVTLRRRGEAARAIATYRKAVDIYESAGLRSSRAAAVWNALGYALVVHGQLKAAHDALMHATRILKAGNIRQVMPRLLGNLANLALVAGDFTTGTSSAEESLAHHRRNGDMLGFGEALLLRARLALAVGDVPTAARHVEEAWKLAVDSASRYDRGHAALVRSWLFAREGKLAASLDAARESENLTFTVCRTMSIVAGSEVARALRRLGEQRAGREKAVEVLGRLETIDGSEWGVETYDAVIEALDGLDDAAHADAVRRAQAYIDAVRERMGDNNFVATFAQRSEVRTIDTSRR